MTSPTDDQHAHRDQQRALYGMPLSERFGAVMQAYGVSQRALAGVLGLSAPMLSQLISAQRIKIGNPAVYERLVMLEERQDETDLPAVLQQVQDSDPVLSTGVSRVRPAGDQALSGSPDDDPRLPATLASQLAMLGTADQLRAVVATARAVQAEELAGLLQAAADHAAGASPAR